MHSLQTCSIDDRCSPFDCGTRFGNDRCNMSSTNFSPCKYREMLAQDSITDLPSQEHCYYHYRDLLAAMNRPRQSCRVNQRRLAVFPVPPQKEKGPVFSPQSPLVSSSEDSSRPLRIVCNIGENLYLLALRLSQLSDSTKVRALARCLGFIQMLSALTTCHAGSHFFSRSVFAYDF